MEPYDDAAAMVKASRLQGEAETFHARWWPVMLGIHFRGFQGATCTHWLPKQTPGSPMMQDGFLLCTILFLCYSPFYAFLGFSPGSSFTHSAMLSCLTMNEWRRGDCHRNRSRGEMGSFETLSERLRCRPSDTKKERGKNLVAQQAVYQS